MCVNVGRPPIQFLCLQTVHAKVVVNSCGVIEGYQLYKLEGLEPKSKMLDYLVEYTTNEDPVTQFFDSYLDTGTEQDFVPVQTMLDAVKEYCHRQGLDYPSETLVRKRLRELLGSTFQRRCGQHQELPEVLMDILCSKIAKTIIRSSVSQASQA